MSAPEFSESNITYVAMNAFVFEENFSFKAENTEPSEETPTLRAKGPAAGTLDRPDDAFPELLEREKNSELVAAGAADLRLLPRQIRRMPLDPAAAERFNMISSLK